MVLKGLSALLIGLCLGFLLFVLREVWFVAHPADKGGVSGLVGRVFVSFPMGGFMVIGIPFGVQGLRKNDSAAVKGLVGAYCFYLAVALESVPIQILLDLGQLHSLDLMASVMLGLAFGLSCVAGAVAYMFSVRWVLRALELDCPSLLQSVPVPVIACLDVSIWMLVLRAALDALGPASSNRHAAIILCICGVLVAWPLGKLVSWLETKQKALAGLPEPDLP